VASHAVAEDANKPILVGAASKLRGVKSIVSATAAPIGPGATAMFEVVTKGKYNRLSLISMLVKTNNAFTGVNSVRLNHGKTIHIFNKDAYDAGSEANNQLSSHIPGLGNQFIREPEGNVIHKHPGIQPGVGDMEIQDAPGLARLPKSPSKDSRSASRLFLRAGVGSTARAENQQPGEKHHGYAVAGYQRARHVRRFVHRQAHVNTHVAFLAAGSLATRHHERRIEQTRRRTPWARVA